MGSSRGKARRTQADRVPAMFEAGDKAIFAGSTHHGTSMRADYSLVSTGRNPISSISPPPANYCGANCVVKKLLKANLPFSAHGSEPLYQVRFNARGVDFTVSADELQPITLKQKLEGLAPVSF